MVYCRCAIAWVLLRLELVVVHLDDVGGRAVTSQTRVMPRTQMRGLGGICAEYWLLVEAVRAAASWLVNRLLSVDVTESAAALTQ